MATNTNDPVSVEAGWVQSPPQEVDGVIETELALGVLHVMVGQQGVDFVGLFIVAEIDRDPLVACRERKRLLLHISHRLLLDRFVEGVLGNAVEVVRNGLLAPEVVNREERRCATQSLHVIVVRLVLSLEL